MFYFMEVLAKIKSLSVSLVPRKGEEEEQVPCSCSHSYSECNCDPDPHNCPCNDHPEVQKERNQRYFLLSFSFFFSFSEDLTFYCSILIVISFATNIEKSGNSEFTYSEVVSITNNFSQTIGRGGFGQVFLGTLVDGTQAAVKARSESSIQEAKALQAEVRQSNIPSMRTMLS